MNLYRNYIEGIIIGSILYFIFSLKKPKNKKSKEISISNYITIDNISNTDKEIKIDIMYFIFVISFSYLYNRIKIKYKSRYI